MTGAAELEARYRRWLRCYPKEFRRAHEAEMLAVLMAGAPEGQRRPEPAECLDLLSGALRLHLRPRVPSTSRCVFAAVRLMYLGAAVELATALVILASTGAVRSALVTRNPHYTAVQWHAEVTGKLDPLAFGALAAVGLWLWLGWANGRGQRWARTVLVVFLGLTSYSLLHGLQQGSAVYARADLAAGLVLWLVQVAAVVLIFRGVHRAGPAAHLRHGWARNESTPRAVSGDRVPHRRLGSEPMHARRLARHSAGTARGRRAGRSRDRSDHHTDSRTNRPGDADTPAGAAGTSPSRRTVMAVITVGQPDVTAEQVSQALRSGLGPSYRVLPEAGMNRNPVGSPRPGQPDKVMVVGAGAKRMFRAEVSISPQAEKTVLQVRAGGLSAGLRLVNVVWIARKVQRVLRVAPELR